MGLEYYLKGRIVSLVKCNKKLYGVVIGRATYRTILDLESNDNICTCPIGFNCKHVKAIKRAYNKKDYIEVDSAFKAILSLLTTTVPLEVPQKNLKKFLKSHTMRAECFLDNYERRCGYASFMEALGIVYSLTLLLTLLKSVKEFKGVILKLLDLSVTMTELESGFPTPYDLIEMLWNIISSNFSIDEFSESELEYLRNLYSRSLDALREDEELISKVRDFLKGYKFGSKINERDFYLMLYGGLLGLEDFYWNTELSEELREFYDVCASTGELECLYNVLTVLALSPNFLYKNPEKRLVSYVSFISFENPEVGRVLKNDLVKIGFKLEKDDLNLLRQEHICIESLSFEKAFDIINEALSQEDFKKALFYAVWIRTSDFHRLAETLKDRSIVLATVLYLKSKLPLDITRDALIELFKEEPKTVKYALIALFQRELNFKTTEKYLWVVRSLKEIKRLAKENPSLETHYLDIIEELVSLNERKKKFLRLLRNLENDFEVDKYSL